MFTVLIAEKKHIDAITEQNRLFFEPFLTNDELVFCEWKPQGQTIVDAVPELVNIVGRREEWKAIIVNPADDEQLEKQNPFDIIDFRELESIVAKKPNYDFDGNLSKEEWDTKGNTLKKEWTDYFDSLYAKKEELFRKAIDLPLQKLVTWLCYKPSDYVFMENVLDRKDAADWAYEKLAENEMHFSTIVERLETEQYKKEIRLKEMLRSEFTGRKSLNIAQPREVYCISERITEHGFFNPSDYWESRNDSEYSEFVDRNLFFDNMRFAAFNVLPRTHSRYREDQIKFLYALMIFSSNEVPQSAMQPRKLYILDCDCNDDPLCTIVTSYDNKLQNTIDVIDNEIEKLQGEFVASVTDKQVESSFCSKSDIPVTFSQEFSEEILYVDNNYGLTTDYPDDEFSKWSTDFKTSQKALTGLFKQQGRGVKKGVDTVKLVSMVHDENAVKLNSFQIEDVREFTETAEDNMTGSIPPDMLEINKYKEKLEEHDKNVKKIINTRMTTKTTIILAVSCLVLYFLCLLPMLITNGGGSVKILATSLTFIGLILGVIAIALIVALFVFRAKLRSAVKAFNQAVKNVFNEVTDGMKAFSSYLSSLCDTKKGYRVLNYSEDNVDDFTQSVRIRRKHKEDIKRVKALLNENYGDFVRGKAYSDPTLTEAYEYDFNLCAELDYPAPYMAGDFRQIDFLSSGHKITVPTSYISCLTIRMEKLYDK